MQDLPLNGRNFVQLATLSARRVGRGLRHARHDHERDAARRPATRHRAVRERQPGELEQLSLRRDRQQHPADAGDRHAPERGGDQGVQGPDQPLLRRAGAQSRRTGQRRHQVRRQHGSRRGATSSCATTASTPTTSSPTAPGSPNRRSSRTSSAAPSAGRSSRTGPSSSPTTTASARSWGACSSTPCRPRRCGRATSASVGDHLRSADHGGRCPAAAFTRQPFPGNVIPQNRWDPVTAKLINAYPLPTSSGACPTTSSRPRRARRTGISSTCASITPRASANNFLGRYSWSKTATINPYTFAPRPARRLVEGRRPRQRGHLRRARRICWRRARRVRLGARVLAAPASWIRAPATTTSISISRKPTSQLGDQLGEQLGVPNANQQDEQNGIPIFSPAGYTGIGHSRSLPILRHEKTFQYVTNLTFAADKHTIKAGFDVRRRHMGEFQTNRGNGRFNFSPEHHQQPGEQHGRPRDGLVPARRAEPDRAGLPAGRCRHPQHRVQRLRRRRLARDAAS